MTIYAVFRVYSQGYYFSTEAEDLLALFKTRKQAVKYIDSYYPKTGFFKTLKLRK